MKSVYYVKDILDYCYRNDLAARIYSVSGEAELEISDLGVNSDFIFYYKKCSDFSLAYDSLISEHKIFLDKLSPAKQLEEFKTVIKGTVKQLSEMDRYCNSEGSFRRQVRQQKEELTNFLNKDAP